MSGRTARTAAVMTLIAGALALHKHAPALANPRNDAEGIATALKRSGMPR